MEFFQRTCNICNITYHSQYVPPGQKLYAHLNQGLYTPCPVCSGMALDYLAPTNQKFVECVHYVQKFCIVHFISNLEKLGAGNGSYSLPNLIVIIEGEDGIEAAHTTLIHEFGHYIRGHGGVKHTDRVIRRREASAWVYGVKAVPHELRPPLHTILKRIEEALRTYRASNGKINYVQRAVCELYGENRDLYPPLNEWNGNKPDMLSILQSLEADRTTMAYQVDKYLQDKLCSKSKTT